MEFVILADIIMAILIVTLFYICYRFESTLDYLHSRLLSTDRDCCDLQRNLSDIRFEYRHVQEQIDGIGSIASFNRNEIAKSKCKKVVEEHVEEKNSKKCCPECVYWRACANQESNVIGRCLMHDWEFKSSGKDPHEVFCNAFLKKE